MPIPPHATYHRRFRRRYPQTLGKDPSEVGGPGPVPQQPAVVELPEGLVALALPFPLDPEDLDRWAAREGQQQLLFWFTERPGWTHGPWVWTTCL
jgi:hypothetical protein